MFPENVWLAYAYFICLKVMHLNHLLLRQMHRLNICMYFQDACKIIIIIITE